ncbi:MAG: hypothetical protein DWQ37_21175 [Planctomycetota bacterium]|nr:MAG: hypothetical protein DWQ37_21175 [Planctomycetota bacterium]
MRLGLGLCKTVLVWSVALLMAVNPASACRWRCWSSCRPSYCAPSSCYSSCYSYSSDCVTYPADDCPICQAQEGGAPVTTNKVPDAAPADPAPSPPQTFEPIPSPSDSPSLEPAPAEPAPAPAPTTPPPADTPAPAPAPEPSFPSEPAPSEPATPAEPAPGGIDDLFSEPADTSGDMPAEPAEPAAPGGVDDLFNDTPPAEPATPAEPSAPSDADDLFRDLDDQNAASEGSSEPAEPAAGDDLDDLFSEPEPAPMSTSVDEIDRLNNEAERLFAESAATAAGNGMRLWSDNTGKYQVRAKLVAVGRNHVRLLKENGKFTTVPHGRLSQQDLAFVRQHAERVVAAAF